MQLVGFRGFLVSICAQPVGSSILCLRMLVCWWTATSISVGWLARCLVPRLGRHRPADFAAFAVAFYSFRLSLLYQLLCSESSRRRARFFLDSPAYLPELVRVAYTVALLDSFLASSIAVGFPLDGEHMVAGPRLIAHESAAGVGGCRFFFVVSLRLRLVVLTPGLARLTPSESGPSFVFDLGLHHVECSFPQSHVLTSSGRPPMRLC